MSDGGKGSRPRPFSVTQQEFNNRWDLIFKKDKKMTPAVENMKKGTCGCGRSPTGDCCGWHSLTEEDYQKKKEEWEINEYKKQAQSLWNDSCTSGRAQ